MKIKKWFTKNLSWLIVAGVGALCVGFLIAGHPTADGYVTIDGSDAQITETTKEWIEDANEALNRIINEDAPTDEETIKDNDEVGLGGVTTLEQILARRKPDGNNDDGRGWQCSKYTAYLATGKKDYSTSHTDYGPVNGKDVAAWLVKNYGFKYIDKPVEGAIGSGNFNSTYGHTVMYLYSTGTNTAMVNDANWTPLKVSTHSMNISGYVWVVPETYNPTPTPTPAPTPTPESQEVTHTVRRGEALGGILINEGYTGTKLYGNDGLAQAVAARNGIKNRGLIYPGQNILIDKGLFNKY